jgi:hypothetical protein
MENQTGAENPAEQGFSSAKEMQSLGDLQEQSAAALAAKEADDAARAEREAANAEENLTDPNVIKSTDVPKTAETPAAPDQPEIITEVPGVSHE